jgi:CRISPR-associated protein Cmr3
MKPIIISPRDPLLFRDGRPFSSDPGSRAKSMPFPTPGTLIGALRTRGGTDQHGRWNPDEHETVLKYAMRGPLLLHHPEQPKAEHLMIPAPLDAIMLDSKHIRALHPIKTDPNEYTNLESAPVGFAQVNPNDKSKPDGMPKYWHWPSYLQWLEKAADQHITPQALGSDGPILETRTHVSMNPASQTASGGALFATSALEFVHQIKDENKLSNVSPLGLYTELSHENPSMHPLFFLGGESRVAHFQGLKSTESLLPSLPDAIRKSILSTQACRVILLTPGYFKHGWKPEYLLQARFGVTPHLQAAVVGKPQVISGWDYALGKNKPTRRLAPVGSVYYLQLEGDEASISEWLNNHWLQNISDEDHKRDQISAFAARKDGFGLCAIGTWDGQPRPLEVLS